MGKYQTLTQQAPSQLNKTARAHTSRHRPHHVQITHHVINTCTLVSKENCHAKNATGKLLADVQPLNPANPSQLGG
jgi:hypothetical protein